VLRFFSFPAVLRKSLRMLETRISILTAPTKLRLFHSVYFAISEQYTVWRQLNFFRGDTTTSHP